MATANASPTFPKAAWNKNLTFTSADGTTLKSLHTGTDPFSRVDFIYVGTDSAVDLPLKLSLSDGTTEVTYDIITVPAGSGNSTSIRKVDVLAAIGEEAIFLVYNAVLKIGVTTALVSGKNMWVAAGGGLY